MPDETQPVYVYGIIRRQEDGNTPSTLPIEGVAGAPVRMIDADGLAALASTLTAGLSLEDELKDPEQAERMVLAHHGVLQSLSDDRTVLPMRFGTLFSDDEKVRDALREHRQALVEALDRLQDAREWGVKIFCDRSVLSGHLGETSQAMRAARDELATAPQGRAFFLQRRIAQLGENEIERAIAQELKESRDHLCEVARAEAAMKHQPAAVHGRAGDMVWNGTYLVARADEERFFGLVEELRRALEPRGFSHEITGPWPPFSFADYRLEQQE